MADANIGIITDLHCGHGTGMTPPKWQNTNDLSGAWREKIHAYQKWAWKEFKQYVKELGPFTHLINLGDNIDGKGKKNGSNEHVTTDRVEQCKMAVATIKATKCKKIVMVRGTGYHVGTDEQHEDNIAATLNEIDGYEVEIHDHSFIDVNGVGISSRHFIGGTSTPAGKATSILKQQISNDQWTREYEAHPKASIFLRGHLHRNIVVDEPSTLSIVAPGLQGWTDFGAKICELPVHFGMMSITINEEGEWQWRRRTAQIGQFVHVTKW